MAQPAFVTVVSGLPRSGTSLMMQMLAAGGLLPLADDARPPDEGNPRGYFEFERVRRLHRDASWMAEARGRALKVVAPLLPHLPGGYRYRVILMERPLAEVVASQEALLARRDADTAPVAPERWIALWEEQLARARRSLSERAIATCAVRHRDAVEEPERVVPRLCAFLGAALDAPAMCAAVDPSLYRQRTAAAPVSRAAAPGPGRTSNSG